MIEKIKEFIRLHETKIVLVFGFILVAILSFEIGLMKGNNTKQKSLIVNSNNVETVCGTASQIPPEASKSASGKPITASEGNGTPRENCALVGSKNSNKYHRPDCQFAKRIKQENITCFKDENEAKLKGYLPDKGCIK